MPSYYFECLQGHLTEEAFKVADCPAYAKCRTCGQNARKIIAPVAFSIPMHMTAENDRVNGAGIAKQKDYINSPETKAKIMSGEYGFDKD